MYGAGDELQLPMDMQIGFINKLDVGLFRQRINEVETSVGGGQPMIVVRGPNLFESHSVGLRSLLHLPNIDAEWRQLYCIKRRRINAAGRLHESLGLLAGNPLRRQIERNLLLPGGEITRQ